MSDSAKNYTRRQKIEHLEKLQEEWEKKLEEFEKFVYESNSWIEENIDEDHYRYINYLQSLSDLQEVTVGLSVFSFLAERLEDEELDEEEEGDSDV